MNKNDSSDEEEGNDSSSNEEEGESVLSYWDPRDDTYRNKRSHQAVPEDIPEISEDEYDSSDEEEGNDSSSDEEEEESVLSYWDPRDDTYRNKRTHQVMSDNIPEISEGEYDSSDEEEGNDSSSDE